MTKLAMRLRALVTALLLLMLLPFASGTAVWAEAPWPAAATNPKPMPDDLVLPMPCGGQMAFRPVFVPGKGRLDDLRMAMGGVDKQYGYKEYQHAAYVAGGFGAAKNEAGRLYYLGKYDVTRLQFAAIGGACPAADADDGALPRTSVTWRQAVDFADAYTTWLIAHAQEAKLPMDGGEPGFLRLPTEQEWEYAARGGSRVSASDFAAPLFPMTQPLAKYAWYDGAESSNGTLQPIGLLLPNPLGLFDMLGDAAQMTAEQFRLNRLSRMSGYAGAQIVRGGSYRTPSDQIRTAARDEYMPYDPRGPRTSDAIGFRLVLVAPALPSLAQVRDVRAEWAALPDSNNGTLAEPAQDDPVKEVQVLAKAADNAEMKRRLQQLEVVIAANIKTRNDQRDRAALANLALASWLGAKMQVDAIHLVALEQVVALTSAGSAPADLARTAKTRRDLEDTIAAYRDSLRSLYTEYPAAVRNAQAAVLRSELDQQGKKPQAAALAGLGADLAQLQQSGDLPTDALVTRMRAVVCASPDGPSYALACKPRPH